jgi:predicted regulator of Ras-like GTPase activity (Roadblock/LC7/MglB family)
MLKPKVLGQLLDQSRTSGVQYALLLSREGALIASSGDSRITYAIAFHIWQAYTAASPGDAVPDMILLDCENGRVIITQVSDKFLLCMYADISAEFGLLRAKALALANYMHEPLKAIHSA